MYDQEPPPCTPAAFRIGRPLSAGSTAPNAAADLCRGDIIDVAIAPAPAMVVAAWLMMMGGFLLFALPSTGCPVAVIAALWLLPWLASMIVGAVHEARTELALLPGGDLHITFRSSLRERYQTIARSEVRAVALVEHSGDDGPVWRPTILFQARDPLRLWIETDRAQVVAELLRVPLERNPSGAARHILGGASATLAVDA